MSCRSGGLALCCAVVLCVLLAAPIEAQSPRASASPANARQAEAFGRLPLSFEPNQGQTSPEVKFLARGPGYGLFLTGSEMVLALRQPPAGSPSKRPTGKEGVLRMSLVGANAKSEVDGERQLPGKSNYFSGKDPAKWQRNVPQFAGVRYRSVYPGVDLVYYGDQRQLEYDFVVAPRANPRAIRLRFGGASSMKVNTSGDLALAVGRQEVIVRAPIIYQEVDGAKRFVAGRFVVVGARDVGFRIGRYDTSRTLVIDPTVVYSTYLGGSGIERLDGAAFDAAGNTYLVGVTDSMDFPLANQPSSRDRGILAKLSPDGRTLLLLVTLLDMPGQLSKIAVDPAGNMYLAGTGNGDFPTLNAVQADCPTWCPALMKLSTTGDLVYSTFLGIGYFMHGTAIAEVASDRDGSTYVTGTTNSQEFPVRNALQSTLNLGVARSGEFEVSDAFVAKLDPQGAWIYSTYLGGSGNDGASSIAVDEEGNAYVAGATGSLDLPTVNPAQPNFAGPVPGSGLGEDGFVAKLNSSGTALVYSTYLGGSDRDGLLHLAVDPNGNAYVTGVTSSTDFPVTTGTLFPMFWNPVLVKFGADGSLLWTRVTESLWPYDLAVDPAGNCYLLAFDAGFPPGNLSLVNPLSAALGGVVIEKLDPTGTTPLFLTYWGGLGVAGGDVGVCIGLDADGNIYVAGNAGSRSLSTLNALQSTPGGACNSSIWDYYSPCNYENADYFIVKIAQSDNTPAGSQVPVVPANGASITFDGVTSPGTTSFARPMESHFGPPQDGLRIGDPPAYYEISTTARYTGGITVCLDYSGITFSVEWGLGLYHYENGTWTNITTSVDTATNTICGVATSLSPFAILGAPLPPVNVAGFAPPLAPLAAEGAPISWPEKAFKFGRTLPLKLQLLVNGTPLTDQEVKAPTIVELSRQGDSVLDLATLDLNTGASNDNGLVFRFSDGAWIYNLNTQALSTGRYVITIELWDGRRLQGGFELKR